MKIKERDYGKLLYILLQERQTKCGLDIFDAGHYYEDKEAPFSIHKDESIIGQWLDTAGTLAHHEAVLFYSKESLERYLRKCNMSECVLINVENARIIEVVQTPITETVTKTEEKIKGYEFTLR